MPDLIDRIIAYESGDLTDDDAIGLFQDLVDTGVINGLQGSYQRTASHLLAAGYITLPEETAQ